MANVIKVTPEKLLETANQMQTKGAQIKKTASDMISLVTGISRNVWSGDAGNTYITRFKALEADTSRMDQMLSKQVKHLSQIAREYKTTEQKTQQAAASLKNHVLT